jgi:hypothetical protein
VGVAGWGTTTGSGIGREGVIDLCVVRGGGPCVAGASDFRGRPRGLFPGVAR